MSARYLIALGAVALFLNIGITGTPKADDAKNIQGTWTVVAIEGAEKPPPEQLKKLRISISADKFMVQLEGKEVSASPYKLNPSKKDFDLILAIYIDQKTVVAKEKQTRLGIYELIGDDLKICVALTSKKIADPSARPKDFKSSPELTLLTLKREK